VRPWEGGGVSLTHLFVGDDENDHCRHQGVRRGDNEAKKTSVPREDTARLEPS